MKNVRFTSGFHTFEFGHAFKRFMQLLYREVEDVYNRNKLRPALYSRKPHKDVSLTHEKATLFTNLVATSGYVGKKPQRFHLKQEHHGSNIIEKKDTRN